MWGDSQGLGLNCITIGRGEFFRVAGVRGEHMPAVIYIRRSRG